MFLDISVLFLTSAAALIGQTALWLGNYLSAKFFNVKQRNHEKTSLLLFHFLNSLELACGTQML